jgi:hypothetical protein
MRLLASAQDARGGITGIVGREAGLFDDLSATAEQRNEFVNALCDGRRQLSWPLDDNYLGRSGAGSCR